MKVQNDYDKSVEVAVDRIKESYGFSNHLGLGSNGSRGV